MHFSHIAASNMRQPHNTNELKYQAPPPKCGSPKIPTNQNNNLLPHRQRKPHPMNILNLDARIFPQVFP